jgi:hypothetical protein
MYTHIDSIYPIECKIKDTTIFQSALYVDNLLKNFITQFYVERDGFNFCKLSSLLNISISSTCAVHISQLIQYVRTCSANDQF